MRTDGLAAPESKITICHWANGGHWNTITISYSALEGHDNHDLDIWPPVPGETPGHNWPQGESVYANDCAIATTPTPTATATPTEAPTASETPTLDPTSNPTVSEPPSPTVGPTMTVTATATAPPVTPTPCITPTSTSSAMLASALVGAVVMYALRMFK